jgi:hypothetical protein
VLAEMGAATDTEAGPGADAVEVALEEPIELEPAVQTTPLYGWMRMLNVCKPLYTHAQRERQAGRGWLTQWRGARYVMLHRCKKGPLTQTQKPRRAKTEPIPCVAPRGRRRLGRCCWP